MSEPLRRIYLDNAATSYPKPEGVYAAVERYQRECGAAHGRGATKSALDAARVVDRCRERAARLLGAANPQQVIFTFNGTDSLNLALHGLLRAGDRVVTTPWEHNSVVRPLRHLEQTKRISVTVLSPGTKGAVEPRELQRAVTGKTRLFVATHASNVTGVLQPVEEMIPMAKAAGCLVLIDAAQSAGHVPIDHLLRDLGADAVACPGHKGMLGPLGTGLLAILPELIEELQPLREGGTGTVSESEEQPATLPDRYESGNHNVPGLWGLEAGLAWIEQRSLETNREHESMLTAQLLEGLAVCPGVTCYAAGEVDRVGVVSFNVGGIEPQVVASILDQHFGIEVRAGLHCAPGTHRALGTFEQGGTVRMSVGPFTTTEDIDAALEAVAQIAASSYSK